MSRTGCLRLADHQAIWDLLHECRERGDDPGCWRRHWAAGLARLVDADMALSGELGGARDGRFHDLGNVIWGLENGFDPAGYLAAMDHLRDDPDYSVTLTAYLRRGRPEAAALGPRDLFAPADWERTVEYQVVYQTLGADNPLWCLLPVPGRGDAVSGGMLARAARRPDFSRRQKAVVAEANARLAPLVGGPLAGFAEPAPSALPPQARRVLRCLLDGDGDKQVAARLGIAALTVNQHTKRVYAHFRVQGRAELLARWVRRGRGAGGWADPG